MAKVDILDIMKTKMRTPPEFKFDSLQIPPMHYFLSDQDVEALHYIATSVKLSSNIKLKYKMIDDIMRPRGFKRFSAGTNRVVYSYYENTSFLAKIAVDKVGMQDNPAEFRNQFLLQPDVTKMFYISPFGTVGFAERVLPVKNKTEFREIASDVFDMLVHRILGKYVVEDIGTKYFMNYGVRAGYGPVLLDYPYVYKLDGKKLFCTAILPETNMLCDGEIDYDEGFNNLICTRCGRKYLACDLRDESSDSKLINIKGGNTMKVTVKYGNKTIHETLSTDDVMQRRMTESKKAETNSVMKVRVLNGNTVINSNTDEKAIPKAPVVMQQPLMKVSVKNGNNTIIAPSCNNDITTTPTDDLLSNSNISPSVIKEVEDKINAEVAAVDEDTKVIVELEIVHDDEVIEPEVSVESTTEEDEEFEPVSQDDQNAIDSIISSRDEDNEDNGYDDYPYDEDEEDEEPKEETVSKYEEYDEEYGKRVKVNKVSKFRDNREKFNSSRVESKFIKSNK